MIIQVVPIAGGRPNRQAVVTGSRFTSVEVAVTSTARSVVAASALDVVLPVILK